MYMPASGAIPIVATLTRVDAAAAALVGRTVVGLAEAAGGSGVAAVAAPGAGAATDCDAGLGAQPRAGSAMRIRHKLQTSLQDMRLSPNGRCGLARWLII